MRASGADHDGPAVDETVVGLRADPEPDTGEQDVVPAPTCAGTA